MRIGTPDVPAWPVIVRTAATVRTDTPAIACAEYNVEPLGGELFDKGYERVRTGLPGRFSV